MAQSLIFPLALAAALAAFPARAATVNVEIRDGSGHPAANAVVALTVDGAAPTTVSPLLSEATIDQRHETFIPLVTLLRKGGQVVFTNNDTTMHQVYSFSPVKQFEFEIDEGQRSKPVVFDKAGVASIGCNIHDQMITYVYVADTPWAVLTDANGRARILNVPAGAYRAEVWHPQLLTGRALPSAPLAVKGDTPFALAIPLMAAPPKKHMHMGSY
jgi:plastocyanin